MDGVNIRYLRKSPEYLWNKFGAIFNPYKAYFRITTAPHTGPNYSPQQDQIFSADGAVQNAFPISLAMSPNPFSHISIALVSHTFF